MLQLPKHSPFLDPPLTTILCSVINWRKLWGSYLSTRKSNPVRIRVNVRRAAGRTIYMRIRCALCTLAITNAHGWINCAGEWICNVNGAANLVLNKVLYNETMFLLALIANGHSYIYILILNKHIINALFNSKQFRSENANKKSKGPLHSGLECSGKPEFRYPRYSSLMLLQHKRYLELEMKYSHQSLQDKHSTKEVHEIREFRVRMWKKSDLFNAVLCQLWTEDVHQVFLLTLIRV